MSVKRVLVERKSGFNVEARELKENLVNNLGIKPESVRVISVYDIEGNVDEKDFETYKNIVLSEPNVDLVLDDYIPSSDELSFRVESLPGQYDQTTDSAMQCFEIISLKDSPFIATSKIYSFTGISNEELLKIKKYLINSIESREVSISKPETVKIPFKEPDDIKIIDNFVYLDDESLKMFKSSWGLAMTVDDLKHIQRYYLEDEKRNPTETEIRVIDTYWSDHCRHTTFLTEIQDLNIEDGEYTKPIVKALELYKNDRNNVGRDNKPITLMDIATLGIKVGKREGSLDNVDLSEEVNACALNISVDVDGKEVPYSLQFKNETHNHPTEIGPYGGAATCLGGAIRDPLSGRSYVYQGMRVTGSSNPLKPINETRKGKLPQRVITKEAANGFSSYGNQIGMATGIVSEYYDEGFEAKRMEVGAVIGAVPKENIVRSTPEKGDIVLLIGGRTGRDGIGGATGSSKEHSESSLVTCGSEVQKGNAPEERKLQNLFRIKEVTHMIKRCNDFGAGGVAVAIGELAPSLNINLDLVKKKYEGLNGTEIAISESQERMAVVISKDNLNAFKSYCDEQNVECTPVAEVTDSDRLIMKWHGKEILNISRDFLNTNGAKQTTKVSIVAPSSIPTEQYNLSFKEQLMHVLSDLNVCSKQGLVEQFDSTIGANTILMPFGGKYRKTPIQAMVSRIPTEGKTNTCSIMSHGYDPKIGKWSPFHGAVNSIIDSISKIIAVGGDYKDIRLSLQEYFERLGNNPEKWGKPMSALLGAYYTQRQMGVYAIGGKDSMSGTFEELNVPPTLVSFAVDTSKVNDIISPELKREDSELYYFDNVIDENGMPNFERLKEVYSEINRNIKDGHILSVFAVEKGGLAPSISKMSFGNKIGVELFDTVSELFQTHYGSMIIEVPSKGMLSSNFKHIGKTNTTKSISYKDEIISIDEAIKVWESTLQSVFPITHERINDTPVISKDYITSTSRTSMISNPKPTVFIPVFPGTNCEVDTRHAFEEAGANVETLIFRNLTPDDVKITIEKMAKLIEKSQIIAIPGGFSAGDQPNGSAKFIVSVLHNPIIREKVMELLIKKDGLMLGICNGFQALVKSGLLPYGEIRDLDDDSPTLTNNSIGRHVSSMVSTRVTSNLSPWLSYYNVGDIYKVPISHGEGRFYAKEEIIDKLFNNGQVATQYVDLNSNPTNDQEYNLNGSVSAIEGITSLDGRIFGKMGHIERVISGNFKNDPSVQSTIFQAGVDYFARKKVRK